VKLRNKIVAIILLFFGLFAGSPFIIYATDYDGAQPNMKAALETLKGAK